MDETTHIPLETALGVKGRVRLRPYGNVKHPHFVLRQIGEEEYEDTLGRKQRRAIFSFFAHKLINVKPGKELFMCVHPFGDELQERVVTVEADISDGGEVDKDERVDKGPDISCLQREQTLPPKLRKLLGRKSSLQFNSGNQKDTPHSSKVSVGVQVDVMTSSEDLPIYNETIPSAPVYGTQMESSTDSGQLLTDQRNILSHSAEEKASSCKYGSLYKDKKSEGLEVHVSNNQTEMPPQRSLSPMEIESASSSPEYSPARLVLDLPDFDNSTSIRNQEQLTTHDSLFPERALPCSNSLAFQMKTEPEEIALPPSPSLHSQSASSTSTPSHIVSSFKYREPTFVPAANPHSFFSSSLSASVRGPKVTEGVFYRTDTSEETEIRNFNNIGQVNNDTLLERKEQIEQASVFHHAISPKRDLSQSTSVPATLSSPSLSENRSSILTHDSNSPIHLSSSQIEHDSSHSPDGITSNQNLASSSFKPQQYHAPPPRNRKKRKRSAKMPATDVFLPELNQGKAEPAFVPPEKRWKSYPTNNTEIWEVYPPSSTSLASTSSFDIKPGSRSTSLLNLAPQVSSVPPFSGWLEPMSVNPDSGDEVRSLLPSEPSYTPGFSQVQMQPSKVFSSPTSTERVASRSVPEKPTKESSYMKLPSLGSAFITFNGLGRESGVNSIVYNMAGDLFAVVCRDSTVRIWSNSARNEVAKLVHNSSVKSVVWLEDDTYSPHVQPAAIASLGTNGIVNLWTLTTGNVWDWSKLFDTGDEKPSCLAYYRGVLAVSNPRRGIKLWKLDDRSRVWRSFDRSITRRDVVSIKFANSGNELLCAGVDGSVCHVILPDLRVRPIITFKTKVFHIAVDATQNSALISRACGRAHLVNINRERDGRSGGTIVQDYIPREAEQNYGERVSNPFGAIFASTGDLVVYGTVSGRILVWDRVRGCVTYELVLGQDVTVQAIASYDGSHGEQFLVSCTRQGVLTWWELPIRLY